MVTLYIIERATPLKLKWVAFKFKSKPVHKAQVFWWGRYNKGIHNCIYCMTITLTKKHLHIAVLSLVLVGLVGYGVAQAYPEGPWFPPAGPPPTRNVAAPVNLSTSTQTKNGDILVDQLVAFTDIRSPKYCDLKGENCLSTSTSLSQFTMYATEKNFNGAVNDNGGQCSCRPGDVLTGCSGYQSKDDDVKAEMVNGKMQCSSQSGSPTCTCMTQTSAAHTYAWNYNEWPDSCVPPAGACSSGGLIKVTMTRTVTCQDVITGSTVADSFCSGVTKPVTSEQCYAAGPKCPS